MIEETFIHTTPDDPLIEPIIDGLFAEYRARYGDCFGEQEVEPLELYAPPDGAFIVLLRHETPIAMGAFKRYNVTTAELKRIWTHSSMRRQGLAQKVLLELERLAALQGYQSLFLTTGFRQPEAVRLYLSQGYQPQFDTGVDPERYSLPPFDGRLPFTKSLPGQTTSTRSQHEKSGAL
ncbi:GNAT family N-acetyltransferase [Kalamiella sp. sgz302252]|uniref:GNAT family N-acetyltransferase n=1 Tax=Pantoea sp. sgz302252 TaxID=3341827 RepID=UPI0036D38E38